MDQYTTTSLLQKNLVSQAVHTMSVKFAKKWLKMDLDLGI